VSVDVGAYRWVEPTRQRAETVKRLAVRVLVGDRLGLVLWLGTLAFVGLYWRLGFLINDNYTIANALVALSEGSFSFDTATYGGLESPGTNARDGTYYGRNYGQVAFALPFLWGLRTLSAVVDPGLLFAALWSLVVLALALQVGRLTGHSAAAATVGSVAALAAFVGNAAVATSIDERLLAPAALQLSAIVATAFGVAVCYRLVARLHDRRVGALAAGFAVVATPVGFWASVPKRHVYVVALVLGVAYALARSRSGTDDDALLSATGFRALAYALVGFLTWVHAAEGVVVFLALVLVDLPTAPSNRPRDLLVIGVVFALSLVPFFVTNLVVSGDPILPPRPLRGYDGGTAPPDIGGGSGGSEVNGGGVGGGGSGDGSTGSGGGSGSDTGPLAALDRVAAFFGGLFSLALWSLGVVQALLGDGAQQLLDDPDRLYRIFVRGGFISDVASEDENQAIYLTVTESGPLAAGVPAAVLAAAVTAARRAGRVSRDALRVNTLAQQARHWRRSPTVATDWFVALVATGFLLVYFPRLPVHATVTVRYLLVFFPFAVYALARAPSLRRVVHKHARAGAWSYVAGVLLGAQLLFVVVTVRNFGRGEAFQLHALVGLAVAAAFAVCAMASVLDARADRPTAVTGGLAAALGTDFLLLSGLVYFQYGPYALPLSDALAKLLGIA